MREIKFRFWSKILGLFVSPEAGIWQGAFTDEHMVVMQYTGLKDKNGKEIYDSDVVKLFYVGLGGVKEESDGILREVVWDDYAWKLKDVALIRNLDSLSNYASNISAYKLSGEIVGNIYENPELLVVPKPKPSTPGGGGVTITGGQAGTNKR